MNETNKNFGQEERIKKFAGNRPYKTLSATLKLSCSYIQFVEWIEKYPGTMNVYVEEDKDGIYIWFTTPVITLEVAGYRFRVKRIDPLWLDGVYLYDPLNINSDESLEANQEFIELAKRHLGYENTQQLSAAKPEKPAKPKKDGGLDVWFDYYYAMKNANYKITFKMLADDSGYSENTFKQAHGNYKKERGITN